MRAFWVVLFLASVVSGCATVDFDLPKIESRAFSDTQDTELGQDVAPFTEAHPGKSGFYLQSDGVEALATRLFLADIAERSIDAQYYLITDDITGYLFIEFLSEAADRGVRVRLLLDDIQPKGYDLGLAALDSHPNFEIRIFNPFARGGPRNVWNAGSFSRINRRMHNKTFTVDNQITIVGGRNIAAEYFAARGDVNFGDMDAVAVGPIVQEVSNQFDTYWNDEYAMPVQNFTEPLDDPEAALAELSKVLNQSREDVKKTAYADALIKKFAFIDEEVEFEDFRWADYQLVYD